MITCIAERAEEMPENAGGDGERREKSGEKRKNL